jgi:drug/metabolite transporter (DMT)-like permease
MLRRVTSAELALVVVSALLHALWSASIKGSRNATAFNLLQLVPTFLAAALLPIWVSPAAIPREVWWLVAATGLFHGFYFYWLGRALETGELSVVYPIARSAPAFLPLVAVPLLGESISLHGALGIGIVVAGMWAVQASEASVQRAAGERSPRGSRWGLLLAPGVDYALLTLLASIGYSLCDKAAMARLARAPWDAPIPPAVVYAVLLSVSGGIVFLPLALRRVDLAALRDTARAELGVACIASLVSYVGYGLILQALRTAPVSYVVAARQTSVLFAVAIAAARYRERPTRLRLIGALATVLGVALVAQQ